MHGFGSGVSRSRGVDREGGRERPDVKSGNVGEGRAPGRLAARASPDLDGSVPRRFELRRVNDRVHREGRCSRGRVFLVAGRCESDPPWFFALQRRQRDKQEIHLRHVLQ
jgi:hypothetical protein